ncbi:sushi, nidogen and EGF-like domain-containing protein 1 [Engystomops pustulosus]|uniref:sushi, nidogen and EGF-like domain-containing protein 1 n=1 Tax=Engystomops pustulosus TaxID=76066 RepID=UPI003AFB58F4
MFISTWDKVAYHGSKTKKVNTFQVVLISDGKLTFLMYNYLDLQWPSLKLNVMEGPSALAGLNNDNGSTYYQLPTSLSTNITSLAATSNVKVNGRWAFNVDTSVIQFTDTFIAPILQLSFTLRVQFYA